MGSYRDLAVYQEGRKLYRLVYDALAELPLEEKYAMASQMRRASISITSNIAEGQGRGTIRDYIIHVDRLMNWNHKLFPVVTYP